MFDKKKSKEKEERVSVTELLAAQEELKELKKQHGIEDKPEKDGLIFRIISFFVDRNAERVKVPVNKKKYIRLALFTGWMGGHRFYCKHYKVGLIYLLLFWMGIGLYNTIIDLMTVIPMEPDENGNIYL